MLTRNKLPTKLRQPSSNSDVDKPYLQRTAANAEKMGREARQMRDQAKRLLDDLSTAIERHAAIENRRELRNQKRRRIRRTALIYDPSTGLMTFFGAGETGTMDQNGGKPHDESWSVHV